MPTWGQLLVELNQSAMLRGGQPDFDGIRRKYLAELQQLTGRDTIIYSTDFLAGGGFQSTIVLEDMQGMMEVCRDLHGPKLDLILHSPGGSAEATASIVRYLRRNFDDIRVFVPLAAMSAATMLALAGNVIVMGKHSQLGPIDPQLVTAQGQVAARAIIDQFERAKKECAEKPETLGAWLPILQQYGPALIQQCENAEALARRLVHEWLEAYMFVGEADPAAKADQTSKFFANHQLHQSHSLGIDRDHARAAGVKVEDLETDQKLQDAVLTVHHAAYHTLSGPAVKIIENHLGRGFFKLEQIQAQGVQFQIPMTPPVGMQPNSQPMPPVS